ncbi:MAG: hypothetical protein OXG44_14905 [Gammaproteobacteria bacterium]|nr:hypothetical protein [Gammaproteobacteria bacterium]
MKPVSFSIRRVNRLRRAAEKARQLASVPDRLAETRSFSGRWSDSDGANDLLRVFDTLHLKAGFALRAFTYRAGGNGNGIIWAVPADVPPVAVDDCPRLEDTWLQPPQPPGAVPLMQAIDGDGSPWSYLSASILSREATEFGAIWHGRAWSDQTILSKPPRQADDPDAEDDPRKLTGDAPVGNWTWHGAAPHTWRPTYAHLGSSREVILHIHNPIGGEAIYHATDIYPVVGSYDARTERTVLCTGDRLIVH